MLKTIAVYGGSREPKVFQFQVPEEGVELREAMRKAVLDYALTHAGRKVLKGRKMLKLEEVVELVPDFFLKKNGLECAEGEVCAMKEEESCIVLKEEWKMEWEVCKDSTPQVKACETGMQFGYIFGVMETLGFLPGRVWETVLHWAVEYLESSDKTDPFAFFERKMKEL